MPLSPCHTLDAYDVVDPAYGFDVPILYAHEAPDHRLFELQILGLLEAGYVPVPLARLVRSLTCCATLPENAIVLTFDDGWESQITEALPVLIKHRIPATFFVLPGFDDKQPNHMSFDDFKALAGRGHERSVAYDQSWQTCPLYCERTEAPPRRKLWSRSKSSNSSAGWPIWRTRSERLTETRKISLFEHTMWRDCRRGPGGSTSGRT